MRARTKIPVTFSAAAAAILLLVAPSLSAASQAAGQTAPAKPGLDFRFENGACAVPAPQGAAGGSGALSRLSLRLYGGYGYRSAGDLNAGSDGYFELFELYTAEAGFTTTGGYRPVHGGVDFGADLVYQISPRFGIGVGAGYLRASRSSVMSITDGTTTLTVTGRPAVSAIPVRLGVFVNFPVSGKLDLTAGAGGTWYAGLKLDSSLRLENDPDNWQTIVISGSQSRLSDLGFQGSFGLEYKLSPRVGLFAEAVGRYARLKNFDSVTGTTTSSDGGSDSEQGKLYLVTASELGSAITMFTVSATPPIVLDGTIREPRFDLSGVSLQAGVRIRL